MTEFGDLMNRMPSFFAVGLCFCFFSYNVFATDTEFKNNDKIADAVSVIKNIGLNGEGHEEAVLAMRVLNQATPEHIPLILDGMDDQNKLAVNWLRSAVVKIAGSGSELPRKKIEDYFSDKQRSHLGRLLAFDLLTEGDEDLANRIIPTLIDDPSLPLRYKAVAQLMERAKNSEAIEAIGMLGYALEKSRDVNQVISITEALDEKGVAIDLQKQLGFVNSWQLVGNFDNKDEKGFDVVYGPEKSPGEIDTDASYQGNGDEPVSWKPYNTTEPTGLVDLNQVVGRTKGVIVYAAATYESDKDQTADIRIGCINAHKVWVNGKLVMSNEIYHNGISPDKFTGQAELKAGDNQILVKVCQNEQTQQWAQRWQFQLRVCDATGKAFHAKSANQPQEQN